MSNEEMLADIENEYEGNLDEAELDTYERATGIRLHRYYVEVETTTGKHGIRATNANAVEAVCSVLRFVKPEGLVSVKVRTA